MKRDMELVRLLLLDVEGEDKPDLSKYTEEQHVYHMALLVEAGLVDGGVVRDSKGFPAAVHAIKLTWRGHEFLDAARSETIWRKTWEKIKSAGVSVTLPVLQELLSSLVKKQLGMEEM